jgi:carboxyl-terminal processing protease
MVNRSLIYSLLLVWQIAWFWLVGQPTALAFSSEQQLVLQAWRTVNQAYYDETFNHQNWWQVRDRTIKQNITDTPAAYRSIEKMLASLDEPFTRFLNPEQYRSLQVNTAGELYGVGLQIGLKAETKQIEVIAPIINSPAARAGIKTHDLILQVDATPTTDLDLDTAAARMRGPAGTNISLIIQSPGQPAQEIILARQKIDLHPVMTELRPAKQRSITALAPMAIGYIRLAQFSAKAPQEMAAAIQNLSSQGATAYVLDLRNNPGGLVTAGIDIARMWLDTGTIVYTVNRQGVLENFEANHQALTTAPLAVLVNAGTASASEILAGALQDNERAVIVGEKTFGKGLIQSLFELPDGSGLAVTVAKYETPNHQDIHQKGIEPQVSAPAAPEAVTDLSADPQYQAAVQALF